MKGTTDPPSSGSTEPVPVQHTGYSLRTGLFLEPSGNQDIENGADRAESGSPLGMSSKTVLPLFVSLPVPDQGLILFKLSGSYAGVYRGGNHFLGHGRYSRNADLFNQDIKQGKYWKVFLSVMTLVRRMMAMGSWRNNFNHEKLVGNKFAWWWVVFSPTPVSVRA